MAPDLSEDQVDSFLGFMEESRDIIANEMGNYIGINGTTGTGGATMNIGESIPWASIDGFGNAEPYI